MKLKSIFFTFLFALILSSSQTVFAQNPNMCTAELNVIEHLINEGYLKALDHILQAHRNVITQPNQYAQIRRESEAAIRELETCKSYFEDLTTFIRNQ